MYRVLTTSPYRSLLRFYLVQSMIIIGCMILRSIVLGELRSMIELWTVMTLFATIQWVTIRQGLSWFFWWLFTLGFSSCFIFFNLLVLRPYMSEPLLSFFFPYNPMITFVPTKVYVVRAIPEGLLYGLGLGWVQSLPLSETPYSRRGWMVMSTIAWMIAETVSIYALDLHVLLSVQGIL